MQVSNVRLDAGDAVQLSARSLPVLRLNSRLIAAWPQAAKKIKSRLIELITLDRKLLAERLNDADFIVELRDVLAKLAAVDLPEEWKWLSKSAGWLIREPRNRFLHCLHLHPNDGLIIRALRRVPAFGGDDDFADEELAASGVASRPVPLGAHSEGVAQLARQFASRCGLPDELSNDIQLAAQLHDGGKADLRFQSLLRGGAPQSLVASSQLLAKSPRPRITRDAEKKAREHSGYPRGARHELLSVRLAESAPGLLAKAHDAELVLHLIGSSHGYCRPFAPVVEDLESPKVEWQFNGDCFTYKGPTKLEHIGSGVAERFWRLTRRYGWWGLAYLEAILRLADHRQSEQEQEADDEQS
jgi:CRISPR-associated endonuclease/helicase Cas3